MPLPLPPSPCPRRPRGRQLAAAVLLGLAGLPAAAMYKVVGPDGSVTYTDRPPITSNAKVTALGRNALPQTDTPALPAELRQIAQRFPVTFYTAADCPPCDAGRALLQQRGVPYAEKRVVSEDDAAVLERSVGGRTVPALTIASQALRGFSATDWTAYLDAAGYPRDSRLPRGWAPASATAAERRPQPASAPAAPPPPPVLAEPAAPSGGIRF